MSLTGEAIASTEVTAKGNSHAHIRNDAIHILAQDFALLLQSRGAFVTSTAKKNAFNKRWKIGFLGERESVVDIVPHFGNRTVSDSETPDFANPHHCGSAVIGDCCSGK